MALWISTKEEITRRGGNYDDVRRERIRAVEVITGRPLIIYATAFLDKSGLAPGEVSINQSDPIGLDEVLTAIDGNALDVLIHSPGGSPEAAESIVTLLRSRFSDIRFIVPHMAKSAATMICCAGNAILMDERSELGPIDPQMQLMRGDGKIIMAPAQAILKQFDKATATLSTNPNQISAWLPILQPLGPALLSQCDAANALGLCLVQDWLEQYMFHSKPDAKDLAMKAAQFLADSDIHFSHGRRIGIEQVKSLGFVVEDLREAPILREAIWALYHAIAWSLVDTAAIKIIEAGDGTAFIRQIIIQHLDLPGAVPLPNPQPVPERQHQQVATPPKLVTGRSKHPNRKR